MAVSLDDDLVVLNVYSLLDDGSHNSTASIFNSTMTTLLSRCLPSIGLGAYHTSIDVFNSCYSYSSSGITSIATVNKHRYKPENATFKESIVLGRVNIDGYTSTMTPLSKVRSCVEHLEKKFFTKTGYHLTLRNCNHFTETLATALILSKEELLNTKKGGPSLKTYPKWINRLARSGSAVLDKSADKNLEGVENDKDSLYCEIAKESRFAAGIVDYDNNEKMAAQLDSLVASGKKRKQKKELTEKQKQMLAKIKGSGK